MVETIAPNVRPVTPSGLQARMQATNMLHLIGQISELRRDITALQSELKQMETAPNAQRSSTSAITPEMLDYVRKSIDDLFANQNSYHAWTRELLRDHAVSIDELTAQTIPWLIDFTEELQAVTGKPAFCDPAKLGPVPSKQSKPPAK